MTHAFVILCGRDNGAQSGDGALVELVKLLIIDEVHLLHEDRGAVIESVVARTLRMVESSQSMIRIVGLSATLPNFADVAVFLRVNPDSGLFFFDNSYVLLLDN
jgi:replicative superfamily II helicase